MVRVRKSERKLRLIKAPARSYFERAPREVEVGRALIAVSPAAYSR